MNAKGKVILCGNAPRAVTDAKLRKPRIEGAVNRHEHRQKPPHKSVPSGMEGIK
jgi:hypothetical protein